VAVRRELAAALQLALGDAYVVVPDPREVPEVGKPLVQLVRTTTKPAPQAGADVLQTDFDLWLVLPYQSAEAGEDALDDALDELLVVLRGISTVLWDSATRSTYGDAGFLAFKIPLSTVHQLTAED
jgi:hypothetical protein